MRSFVFKISNCQQKVLRERWSKDAEQNEKRWMSDAVDNDNSDDDEEEDDAVVAVAAAAREKGFMTRTRA